MLLGSSCVTKLKFFFNRPSKLSVLELGNGAYRNSRVFGLLALELKFISLKLETVLMLLRK